MRTLFVARLAVVLVAACTQPRSKTCVDTCSRESDCIAATKSDIPFDEKECVAACEVLRQDELNLAKVEQHHGCIEKAGTSCQAVLECP